MSDAPSIDKVRAEIVRSWVQSVHLSKPIRNLARDLSDGVLVAELIAHFLPRYVTLSNFAHVNSVALKRYNWETLQKVVFRHLNFSLTPEQIQILVSGLDQAFMECVLFELKLSVDKAIRAGRFRPSAARRSRSCASSRGASSLDLSQANQQPNDETVLGSARTVADVSYNQTSQVQYSGSNGQHHSTIPNDLTKDQIIERLYARIHQMDRLLAQKDNKIAELTRKMEKLVEMICQRENELVPRSESLSGSPSSTQSGELRYGGIYRNGNGSDTVAGVARRRQRDASEIFDALDALDL